MHNGAKSVLCVAFGLAVGLAIRFAPSSAEASVPGAMQANPVQDVRIINHIETRAGMAGIDQTLRVRNSNIPGSFRVGNTVYLPEGVPLPNGWQSRNATVSDVVGEWAVVFCPQGPAGNYWIRPASFPVLFKAN